MKATNETIARYLNDRLKTIFSGVAEPGVLRNSLRNPLYLLCQVDSVHSMPEPGAISAPP